MNNQTLNFENNITKLHKTIVSEGKRLQIYDRFRVGCKPTVCGLYDLVVLQRIVCKDLCYINKKEMDIINDYLIRR